MIIFTNPGLIDLMASTTMGVSVKNPGSFGRFGTGFKYAVARILRGGGAVTVWRGRDKHVFGVQPTEIRGEVFDLVTLDGVPTGFTTLLGKDWESWHALRELGCNARDEGGEFHYSEIGRVKKASDRTAIVVESAEMDAAFAEIETLFLSGEPILATADLRILPGPSDFIYYRGVRVYKTEKPSLFTYDILREIKLTEDRTIANIYEAEIWIRRAIMDCADIDLIEKFVSARDGNFEAGIKFSIEYDPAPSTHFLTACHNVREGAGRNLSESAKQILLKRMRKASGETGEKYMTSDLTDDDFQHVIDLLKDAGFEFACDQAFVCVDELPGEALSILEDGKVFYLEKLLVEPLNIIAQELVRRWVDLSGVWSLDDFAKHLASTIIAHISVLAQAKKYEDERLAALKAEAKEALPEVTIESPPALVSADDDMPF